MTEAFSKPQPPTFAIVELMGHVKHAGRLSEEEKFGVKLGRIDCPAEDGSFTTIYFGGASVYRITVVTEDVAMHVAHEAHPRTSPGFGHRLRQRPHAEEATGGEDSRVRRPPRLPQAADAAAGVPLEIEQHRRL